MELFVGKPSSFYDFVKKELLVVDAWLPFRDARGSPRRGLVDIYVRLNADKSIILSTFSKPRKKRIMDQKKAFGVLL